VLQGGVPPEDVPPPADASVAAVEAKEGAKAEGCAAPRRAAPHRTARRTAPNRATPPLASACLASPQPARFAVCARVPFPACSHDRAHGSAAAGDESDEDGGDGNSEEF
jgi:hypothetical protein